jgi:hypothetical protein
MGTAPHGKEVAERGFRALSDRDLEGVLAVLDTEVQLTPLLTGADATLYEGHEGARRWLTEIWDAWERYRVVLRWARDVDERTTVICFVGTLRRHDSDIDLETEAYGVMERDRQADKITAWRFFATEREAFAAAEARTADR